MKVIKPQDIADRLDKSVSWVYNNAAELGGSKIGGAWIFTEEGLDDAIERGRQVARDRMGQWPTRANKIVPLKTQRRQMGKAGKETIGADPDPFGLLT